MVEVDQPAVVELSWQVGTADPELAGQVDVAGRDRLRLLPSLPGLEGSRKRRLLRLRLEHSPSDHERLCRGYHHETEKQRKGPERRVGHLGRLDWPAGHRGGRRPQQDRAGAVQGARRPQGPGAELDGRMNDGDGGELPE
jgi:hypothetical protein